ncbi:MAG: LacI family transcriptional regulator [Bacteroidia bacterium]|nr:LacI family transcriptional regulator [Bacteroidia bacterium]
MATMKDVAKATGLSLATVSRVFNSSEKVTEKTRKAVLKAAEKLNFQPNKMAAALRSGKSKTIGVVVPIIDNDVFSSAIKSMESYLRASGYHLIISQSYESLATEKEILKNLMNLQVDGIIISVSKETTNLDHMKELREAGVAVVLFDRNLELIEVNSIVINNFNGAFQATSHLIEQGCKKIIHLAGKESVNIFSERARGYKAAILEKGLNFEEKHIIPFDEGNPDTLIYLEELFRSVDRPDGIFAHGDISALVALNILKKLEISVPEEVCLIGFGNSPFCSYLSPTLSSVNQRNEAIGKLAAETILQEILSKIDERVYKQSMLPPVLIARGSSSR